MRFGLLLLAAALLPGRAFAYGEPDEDGVPDSHERLLHVLTNQIRQAPHDWPGWDTSLATGEPRPPLAHQVGLGSAARFHADDMKAHGCFQHESCDGTSFESRVSRYFSGGAAGENIYTSFGDKSARTGMTAWMNSEGHRTNILRPEWTHLGTGTSESASEILVRAGLRGRRRREDPDDPGGGLRRGGRRAPGELLGFRRAGRRGPSRRSSTSEASR